MPAFHPRPDDDLEARRAAGKCIEPVVETMTAEDLLDEGEAEALAVFPGREEGCEQLFARDTNPENICEVVGHIIGLVVDIPGATAKRLYSESQLILELLTRCSRRSIVWLAGQEHRVSWNTLEGLSGRTRSQDREHRTTRCGGHGAHANLGGSRGGDLDDRYVVGGWGSGALGISLARCPPWGLTTECRRSETI